jgi:hypothetical protein
VDDIADLFLGVKKAMAKPTFHEVEYNPLKIDSNKENSTFFKMMISENDSIKRCA